MKGAFVKAVVWNDKGYLKPSGQKFTSGWAKDHGYGAEEWNHSPKAVRSVGGKKYRYFYTGHDGIPSAAREGEIILFLVASHGDQRLVSIAGKARYIADPVERLRIADELEYDTLGEDAWRIPEVQKAHSYNKAEFEHAWANDRLAPVWECEDSWFLKIDEPITVKARSINGKENFPYMYSLTTELSWEQAATMLSAIKEQVGADDTYERISAEVLNRQDLASSTADESLLAEIQEIEASSDITATQKLALIRARLGQGRFRLGVLNAWGKRCAVTGSDVTEVLRASHIKPWSQSSNKERLDPENGLLLVATLDGLFDRGLITFTDAGNMMVSSRLTSDQAAILIDQRALRRKLSDGEKQYLRWHRDDRFLN